MHFQNPLILISSAIGTTAMALLSQPAPFSGPFVVASSDPVACSFSQAHGTTNLDNSNSNKGFGDCKQVSWKSDNILISYGSPENGFTKLAFYTDAHCQHVADVPTMVGSYNGADCLHPGVYGADQIHSVRKLG